MIHENGYYNPVSAGEYSLNVVKFGNNDGKHTFVAMAGPQMGDCSAAVRQLASCLEENNLVVFIDRAGYGLSEDTANEMTLIYIV